MDTVVTVVVPTHDRLGLVRRTLATVLAQRDVDVRVVVVDDGSEDGTFEAFSASRDARVHVVRNERATGVAGARNRGLEEVASDWVAFLDDDDLWAPDKLASQLAAAAATPEARWVCAGAVTVDEDLRVLAAMRPPPSGPLPTVLSRNRIPGGASGPGSTATALTPGGSPSPPPSPRGRWSSAGIDKPVAPARRVDGRGRDVAGPAPVLLRPLTVGPTSDVASPGGRSSPQEVPPRPRQPPVRWSSSRVVRHSGTSLIRRRGRPRSSPSTEKPRTSSSCSICSYAVPSQTLITYSPGVRIAGRRQATW